MSQAYNEWYTWYKIIESYEGMERWVAGSKRRTGVMAGRTKQSGSKTKIKSGIGIEMK